MQLSIIYNITVGMSVSDSVMQFVHKTDVECVNSASNRSKDIISFIIKVCRCFLLNNKIFIFHDLFIFTEWIDKQQPLFNLLQ